MAVFYNSSAVLNTASISSAIISTANAVGLTATSISAANLITGTIQSANTAAFYLTVSGGNSKTVSQLVLSNANGVTFGLSTDGNANQATLTASAAGGGGNVNFSAGTTSNNLGTVVFSNSNNVSFGLNGSTITASATAAFNFSAGTTSNNLTRIVFSNSNNVSFGLNGSTVTASAAAGGGVTQSFLDPFPLLLNTAASTFATSHMNLAGPVLFPNDISMGFVRIPASYSIAQTSLASSAAAGVFSATNNNTFFVNVYSLGTGGSSLSLMYLTSTTATMQLSVSVTYNNSTYTARQSIIAPFRSGYTTVTASNVGTSAQYQLLTLQFSNVSGLRYMDIPFGQSLSAGDYVFGFWRQSSTAGTPAAMSAQTYNFSYAVITSGATFREINSNGLFKWAQGMKITSSTNNFDIPSMTTTTNAAFIPYQIFRIA
jgi:hypothetical protein